MRKAFFLAAFCLIIGATIPGTQGVGRQLLQSNNGGEVVVGGTGVIYADPSIVNTNLAANLNLDPSTPANPNPLSSAPTDSAAGLGMASGANPSATGVVALDCTVNSSDKSCQGTSSSSATTTDTSSSASLNLQGGASQGGVAAAAGNGGGGSQISAADLSQGNSGFAYSNVLSGTGGSTVGSGSTADNSGSFDFSGSGSSSGDATTLAATDPVGITTKGFTQNPSQDPNRCQVGTGQAAAAGLDVTTGSQTVSGACVYGDPQFVGFDGRKFDYMGVPGEHFNLLSEHDHQVNALFAEGQNWDHKGTFISSVGMKLGGNKISISAHEDDTMTVTANGEELTASAQVNKAKRHLADGVTVVFERFRPRYGQIVDVITPKFVFTIFLVPKYVDAGGVQVSAYLNFGASIISMPSSELKGILGETFATGSEAKVVHPDDNQWYGKGTDADYMVSSLFEHDSAHNMFGLGEFEPSQLATVRKMLQSSKISFPVVALFAMPDSYTL